MYIIFLFILFALPVQALEIDLNYRWYKYKDSSYMTLDESKDIKGYIDYSDYLIDEYYDINSYNDIEGGFLYIYNKSGKPIKSIESINIYSEGEKIYYLTTCEFADLSSMSSKGRIMFDLRLRRKLKDIEVEINYDGGDLLISFSDTGFLYDSKLAQEHINSSGKYKISHVKNHQEIKYKTYYNRVNGNYSKNSYDDFIYKDTNDYKINYFSYKKVIDKNNMTIYDLFESNYNFLRYEGNIDFNKNGNYRLKLIFKECEKVIDVTVDIDNEIELKNKEIDNLKEELNNKSKDLDLLNIELYEERNRYNELLNSNENKINDLNNEINELNKSININNKEIDNLKEELNNKNKDLDLLNIKLYEERNKYKELLKSNENKINDLNNEINELNKLININNKEINKLKKEQLKYKKNINEYKNKIKKLNNELTKYNKLLNENNNKINELNELIQKYKSEININKKIYEQNKTNYKKIVTLKNQCFNTLNDYKKTINYLDLKYTNDKEYYERYIKKLKYVIDEKNSDFWTMKKRTFFVDFITNNIKYGKVK